MVMIMTCSTLKLAAYIILPAEPVLKHGRQSRSKAHCSPRPSLALSPLTSHRRNCGFGSWAQTEKSCTEQPYRPCELYRQPIVFAC
jgi:hypothetical protein